MRVLLDTCALIWLDSDPSQLSARAAAVITDPRNTVYLSVVNVWEVVVKVGLGKLALSGDVRTVVDDQVRVNRFVLLPLDYEHVLAGTALPSHHKDPYDRLLVCQAQV